MNINWFGYFMQNDGYGRFNTRLVRALQELGQEVRVMHIGDLDRPALLLAQMEINWKSLHISCCAPYMLKWLPGRHWLFSMTEGSLIPQSWVEKIYQCNIERVIVPCEHNVKAFRDSGVTCPISVVPGGTDPKEFPVAKKVYEGEYNRVYPYTFLTIADRGFRKGWDEVREAFYIAFGGKTTGKQDVRLIIKSRPKGEMNDLLALMSNAKDKDPRIIYKIEDNADPYNLYLQADCLALPSRSEGWGMPHREAACMGLPVITQAYSGLDDGFTHKWAIPVRGEIQPIPKEDLSLGEWQIADTAELAEIMFGLYSDPAFGVKCGLYAARWIRNYQTWHESALSLLGVIYGEELESNKHQIQMERSAIPMDA